MLAWLAVGLAVPLIMAREVGNTRLNDTSVAAATRFETRLYQPITIDPGLRLSISGGRMRLDDGDASLSVARRDALVADGSGQFVVDNAHLSLFAGNTSQVSDTALPPLLSVLARRAFRTVKLRNAKLLLALPDSHTAVIKTANLALEANSQGGTTLSGTGRWRGIETQIEIMSRGEPTPVEPEAAGTEQASSTGSVANASESKPSAPPRQRQSLEIRLTSKLFDLEFRGDVSLAPTLKAKHSHLTGTLQLTSQDGGSLVQILAPGIPAERAPQTLSLATPVTWDDRGLSLADVSLNLQDQSAVGALSISRGKKRHILAGTLDFDRLDLAAFGKPAVPSAPSVQSAWASATTLWDRLSRAFEKPFWRMIDVDLRVSAEDMLSGEFSLGRTAAAVALSGGQFNAHVAEFSFAEGAGTGQVSIDFTKAASNISVRGKISDARVETAMEQLFGGAPLRGTGSIKFDLVVDPAVNPHENAVPLRKALAGTIHLSAGTDSLSAIVDLPKLTRVASPTTIKGLLGSTRLSAIDAEIALFRGQAYCRALTVRFDDKMIRASGIFDPVTASADFRIEQGDPSGDKNVVLRRWSLARAQNTWLVTPEALDHAYEPGSANTQR